MDENKATLDKITEDLTFHIRITRGFKIWMGFLIFGLGVCLYAYTLQLRFGLGVAGIRDYVSWGLYIANFVFFVATSLIGMLISGVLGLIGIKWITPIARIAEIIAVAFAALAGLVIVMDMGRPDRLANVFIYGRFQSPILWDVTVVTTYFVLSTLLLFVTMISDIAWVDKNVDHLPGWVKKSYKILSLNWTDTPEKNAIIRRSVRILLLLIIPCALAIHTVTSWLFAMTSRAGWDSTLFGPYFVSGAFVSGTSAVLIAMYFFQKNYKLHNYITDNHFDKMGKLLVLLMLVYFYFNINEFFVPGYKLKTAEAITIYDLFTGRFAFLFWAVQIGGLIFPIILLLFRKMRAPLPSLILALAVFVGAWFKRYIIVVPTQEHPYLPIQYVPYNFKIYTPTLTEAAITLASFFMVLIIITILSKFFPVIPIRETAVERGLIKEEENREL
ncbi:MAG: NrfD/PsrC family molybdoenzyme membrane anchor subunit [Bacteroidales bacterium]|jgi:molybdopterin-containing oxidoreductase family membrane subunit